MTDVSTLYALQTATNDNNIDNTTNHTKIPKNDKDTISSINITSQLIPESYTNQQQSLTNFSPNAAANNNNQNQSSSLPISPINKISNNITNNNNSPIKAIPDPTFLHGHNLAMNTKNDFLNDQLIPKPNIQPINNNNNYPIDIKSSQPLLNSTFVSNINNTNNKNTIVNNSNKNSIIQTNNNVPQYQHRNAHEAKRERVHLSILDKLAKIERDFLEQKDFLYEQKAIDLRRELQDIQRSTHLGFQSKLREYQLDFQMASYRASVKSQYAFHCQRIWVEAEKTLATEEFEVKEK